MLVTRSCDFGLLSIVVSIQQGSRYIGALSMLTKVVSIQQGSRYIGALSMLAPVACTSAPIQSVRIDQTDVLLWHQTIL